MAGRLSAEMAARVFLRPPGLLYFSRAAREGIIAGSSDSSLYVSRTGQGSLSEFMRGLNRGISSSSEGSDKSAADKQREDILETGKRVDVGKVKDVPAPTKQKWWKPDPITGVWVPEDNDVHVDTAQLRAERMRSTMTASLEEGAWWSSMEDLPDRIDREK